ncbi:hypothetical protein [Ruegeria sp. EL01]|jgi:hypothetical protein|nr:hypothetical protein [Ruegeria sp. EL01]
MIDFIPSVEDMDDTPSNGTDVVRDSATWAMALIVWLIVLPKLLSFVPI